MPPSTRSAESVKIVAHPESAIAKHQSRQTGARLTSLTVDCFGNQQLRAVDSRSLCLDGWVRPRLRGFAPVAALLVGTGDERAVALRVLLEEVRLPALRTWAGNRPVPRRELAVRVVHAAVEVLSEARFALGEPAAAVGTDHALQGDGLGGLASGIVRAREEPAEPAALVQHRLAASGADLLGGQILDHPDRAIFLDEVLGVLAVWVPGAGQKAPHAAPLDHHR